MTERRARELRNVLSEAMQSVSDEIAVANPKMYPEWEEGKAYTIGYKFRYDGVLYKALQDHTSHEAYPPDITVSLYARVLYEPGDDIKEWEQPESTNPYMKGDRVYHNGKLWESTIDNNVFEPGVAGWIEVTD